jgi:hypothetical protein
VDKIFIQANQWKSYILSTGFYASFSQAILTNSSLLFRDFSTLSTDSTSATILYINKKGIK